MPGGSVRLLLSGINVENAFQLDHKEFRNQKFEIKYVLWFEMHDGSESKLM